MGIQPGSKETCHRSLVYERNVTKQSLIVVCASVLLKLYLLVLPLFVVLALPRLLSTHVDVASFVSGIFNRCNLSPNHVFLILNSIIAAIAATSKISRTESAEVRAVAVNTRATEIRTAGSSEQCVGQKIALRTNEQNRDLCTLGSKIREALQENVGMEERLNQVQTDRERYPLDGTTTSASIRLNSEATKDEPQPAPQTPQQATAGDSMEEIWKAITDKRQCSSFNDQKHASTAEGASTEEIWKAIMTNRRHRHRLNRPIHDEKNHIRNQAVRRAPSLSRLTRVPNSVSRCKHEVRKIPDLHCRALGRKPSKGVEELKKKSEEFIARFSARMRLQREESLVRYMRMGDQSVCH